MCCFSSTKPQLMVYGVRSILGRAGINGNILGVWIGDIEWDWFKGNSTSMNRTKLHGILVVGKTVEFVICWGTDRKKPNKNPATTVIHGACFFLVSTWKPKIDRTIDGMNMIEDTSRKHPRKMPGIFCEILFVWETWMESSRTKNNIDSSTSMRFYLRIGQWLLTCPGFGWSIHIAKFVGELWPLISRWFLQFCWSRYPEDYPIL